MPGPSNAVMGDLDEPMNLPETTVPDEILDEEKKLAAYSKTAEFKRLKEFLEARIQFFQRYLPGGQKVSDVPENERAAYWQASCIVIDELQRILDEYQNAVEVVKNAADEGR